MFSVMIETFRFIPKCPCCKRYFGTDNGQRAYCSENCKRQSLHGFKSIRDMLVEKFGCCWICGGTHKLEVHHILQRSKGGTHDVGNLMVLCAHCHDVIHNEYRRAEKRGYLAHDHSNVFEYILDWAGDQPAPRPWVP